MSAVPWVLAVGMALAIWVPSIARLMQERPDGRRRR